MHINTLKVINITVKISNKHEVFHLSHTPIDILHASSQLFYRIVYRTNNMPKKFL